MKSETFIMSEYDVKLVGNPDDIHEVRLLINLGCRLVALQADAGFALARSFNSARIQGKSEPCAGKSQESK